MFGGDGQAENIALDRDIAIIGPGKAGTAIGVVAARAGCAVVAVGGRDAPHAAAAARRIGETVRACEAFEAARSAGLVFLTVPDDIIEETCGELARRGAFKEGTIVAHCSGLHGCEVLSAARELCGCRIASMHPMQTLPTVEAAQAGLPGAHCFCEGDEEALLAIEQFAERLGMKPVRISPGAKTLCHAAAVVACNYLVAIMDAALALADKADIERSTAWSALEPLVAATLRNVSETGPAGALTGPISRGDADTVRRHLESIGASDDRLERLYRAVGSYVVDIAIDNGTIAGEKAAELRRLLSGR